MCIELNRTAWWKEALRRKEQKTSTPNPSVEKVLELTYEPKTI